MFHSLHAFLCSYSLFIFAVVFTFFEKETDSGTAGVLIDIPNYCVYLLLYEFPLLLCIFILM